MTTIAEGVELLKKGIDSGRLKPVVPPSPTAYTVPTFPPEANPLLRGPMPASAVLTPDTVRQFNSGAIPQTRILPPAPTANPVVGAQAQSQSIVQIAATPVTTVTTSGSGTDTDLISAVSTQSFGSIDAAFQQQSNAATTGFTFNVNLASSNELAIAMGDSHIGFGGAFLNNPGGWTLTGSVSYVKVFSAAGPQTVPVTFGGGGPWRPGVAGLALFKTNGSAPGFTNRGSGSGGFTVTSAGAFTPAAGSSLMFMSDTPSQSTAQDITHVTDTAGNVWVKLIDSYATYFDTGAGLNYSDQVVMWYAQNVQNVSTTIAATVLPAVPGGVGGFSSWQMFEISNLTNGTGSYTFQTSDSTKLVEFSGGTNVTATLPNPALTAGWQALAANNGAGVVTITSTALLNGNTVSPVLLGGGTSTWIFSDGSGYWTAPISTPQSILASTNLWLDGYSSYTGLYSRSQPDFPNLSGVGKATKYNNTALVANGFPSEYAAVDRVAQTGNVAGGTTLYSVPSNGAGLYRISVYIIITQAATTSSTLPDTRIAWTDQNNSVNPFIQITAPSTANTTSTFFQAVFVVNAKANTGITYDIGQATPYASAGVTPMQYAYHSRLEYLG